MNRVTNPEEKGTIGRVYENTLPVIYKFVNEMPALEERENLTWLAVISWKYDGSKNNGMPLVDENKTMNDLEDAIEDNPVKNGFCRHAYSRTGNNLKELVYYIHDQVEFMNAFNKALASHPHYPIEISFYEDRQWEDFQQILNDFKR